MRKDPLAVLDAIPRELLPAALARIAARLLEASASVPSSNGQLLTVDQVAERLGVSTKWIYRHQDDLGAIRLGGVLRIPVANLEAYVARQNALSGPQ